MQQVKSNEFETIEGSRPKFDSSKDTAYRMAYWFWKIGFAKEMGEWDLCRQHLEILRAELYPHINNKFKNKKHILDNLNKLVKDVDVKQKRNNTIPNHLSPFISALLKYELYIRDIHFKLGFAMEDKEDFMKTLEMEWE